MTMAAAEFLEDYYSQSIPPALLATDAPEMPDPDEDDDPDEDEIEYIDPDAEPQPVRNKARTKGVH